ncbi:hypothetical protein NQ315_005906 [Exocentrus adspersus]|uniref:Regulatory protein zeste n=1 Tax=Exocentrus adspersus TaxID=1586481 RepID=A0AAV8V5Y2_9CUCU|nr:hypothetical protein NQ315_005906 [Exocentrus adspersus]
MSKSVAAGNKIIILKEIREHKDTLFGSFSNKLTKQDKIQCWKEIHEKSASLGLVAPDKEWTYSRDGFWQNLKKSTVKKVDNRRKTGSAGGIDCKLTDIDNIVLDILGPTNPIISSLGVPESLEQETECSTKALEVPETENQVCTDKGSLSNTINGSEVSYDTNNNNTSKNRTEIRAVTKKKKRFEDGGKSEDEDTLIELKNKKLRLQIKILEKEEYLKTLQILKLEREQHIPPSEFTASFPSVSYFINIEESATEAGTDTENP